MSVVRQKQRTVSPWFPGKLPQTEGFRLFCFPYAGGASMVYREWQGILPGSVEVVAVELPGRGSRRTEPPFLRMGALVKELAQVILPFLGSDFALYGHSMGAVIAFELARELRRQGMAPPRHIFVSGRQAPQIPDSDPPTYGLPEEEFIAELRRLNGTPKEVLEHEELMQLIMPILRADFELIQTYEFTDEAPLECPIDVYGGAQDIEVPREKLVAWRVQTAGPFGLHILPGDHFFIRSAQSHLLALVRSELINIRGDFPRR